MNRPASLGVRVPTGLAFLAASLLAAFSSATGPAGAVSISGPTVVAVGDTIELTAQGSPAGGTYLWELVRPSRTPVTSGRARLVDARARFRTRGNRLELTGISPSAVLDDIRIRVRYERDGTSCEATHAVTCVTGDLIAYRPVNRGSYFPFARTRVQEDDEESSTLGAGIRINGNGDTDPAGEDDLIELVVRPTPANTGFVLRRSSPDLAVWTSPNATPGTQLAFTGDTSAVLPFGAGATQLNLGVEWAGSSQGTASLELLSVGSSTAADRLVFHTFQSITLALGGEGQVPTTPLDPNHGTFAVAIELYRQGYDVQMFDEDAVGATGLGAVYDEIVTAIQDRGVDELAIYGYSHGGGSTYHLSERLDIDRLGIGTFDIVFTSYVDGVRNSSDTDTAMELRRPPTSAYHANHYQIGTFAGDFNIDGGPVPNSDPPPTGLDVETTAWGVGATHFTVDDFVEVRDFIEQGFLPRVTR